VDAFSRIPLPGVLIGTFIRFRDVVSEFRHACHAAVGSRPHRSPSMLPKILFYYCIIF
jgi:hypothetical protein